MIGSMQSSVSALYAFQKKMNSTAHNIANVNTDGYQKSRVLFQESRNGGVEAEVDRVQDNVTLSDRPVENNTETAAPSNVDLSEELPELMISKAGYTANLKAVQTQDEMLGSLLDVMA